MQLHPTFKSLLFALIPLSYLLLEYVNFSQAGKAIGLAFFVLTPLFFWKKFFINNVSTSKKLSVVINIVTFIMVINLGFHGFLRYLFGMEQNDLAIMEALFNTTPSESSEFLQQNIRFILQHLTLALFFFSLYWVFCIREVKPQHIIAVKKSTFIGAIIFSLLLVLVHFNPTLRRFNPVIYFPYYYLKWQNTIEHTRATQEKLNKNHNAPELQSLQYIGPEKNTVVFVIGESDTRHNWSLYNYPRNTNEKLSTLKDELFIFKHIRSADASTIASLQKMLTAANLKKPERWQSSPDIMIIAKKLGYKVFWLDNQGMPNQGIISIFASHADESIFTNKSGNLGESSFDEVLQAPFEKALNDPAPRKFIIVHITGAHPAYLYRYPSHFSTFDNVSDTVSNQLSSAGRAPWAIIMRAQYDNATRYTDHNLHHLLMAVKNKKDEHASWIYIADHGQDVAHHSNFSGHNKNADQMWEVPLLFWSNHIKNINTEDKQKLINQHYQADEFNHTVLGLLGANGALYNPEHDLLRSLHKHSESVITKSLSGETNKGK